MNNSIARPVIGFVEYIGKLASMLAAALSYIARLAIDWRLTFFQMSSMGINSIPIVFLIVSFTGMIISLQVTEQAIKFGTKQFIGGGIAFVMVRELAPVLTAVAMAGRVGSSMASELASMKVSEQIDALRALATNPVQYLVVPRMLALIIMIPAVTIISGLAGIMAAYWIAYMAGGVTWPVFYRYIPKLLHSGDVTAALIKSGVFAVTIALIGCTEGMHAEGGAQGVGRATTNSVVASIVSIFGLNYLLSMLLFRP
jgi:phospholipid/cholesterol/gamma-HCH transport system permease protein